MSIKLLKQAILARDWNNVEAAYENMTGETLQVEKPKPKPKKKRGRPPKKDKEEQEIEQESLENKPPPKRKRRKEKPKVVKRKAGRREQIDTEHRRMRFFDGGQFENQKVSKGNPFGINVTSIRESEYQPVEVQCQDCKEYFEVPPTLAIRNFKCNDCICGRK